MIETQELTKQFDGYAAVDRLTVTIEQGEVFGFLGPNGAGKTTTVRMLTSLIAPTSGHAKILDYVVGQDDQMIRRNVGILTETPGLYSRLSARRNLLIYARLYEVEDGETQVEKYLKWLELWDRRDDLAGEFSKGMRQKLAIARALIHEPRVLFLDEPTAGLDPEASKLVREFISELRGQGRTIFICTHNLDEADRLCDRVAVFKSQLRVVDTPAQLRKQLYGRQVVVHLAEDAGDMQSVALGSPGVKACEAVDNKLLITLDEPERDNPEIVRRLVSHGAQVQFVGEIRHSLEDIYLQLLEED
jgi:ABC-2 type transport system ATP-binding protein